MPSNATDDELRYAALLDHYRAHIVGFCVRHSDSPAEADDLMQEVMIAVWENTGALRGDSTPPQVNRWLQKVMRTTYVRHLRAKPRYTALPLEAADGVADSDDALRETLDEMMAHLSPDDREVVQQRLRGYDNGEIADSLGVSANNVNLRFFRIKNRLKKIYLRIYGK